MSVAIESSILVLLRLVLFFSCRKFLIQSLYSDLQSLSPTSPSSEDDIPMTPLPTPATASSSSAVHSTHDKTIKTKGKLRPLHWTLSRAVFALCFSESCMPFVLLMAQGLELFDPRTRLLNWKWSISLLLITVLVVTPLFMSLVISLGTGVDAVHRRIFTPRLLLTLSPLIAYLYLLSLIPLPPTLKLNSRTDVFTATLARLVVLGTIILGLLSGVGAVAGLEELFGKSKSAPTTRDIEIAERSLGQVREDMENRKREAQQRAEANAAKEGGGWVSRYMPTFGGGDDYALEIKGLEALEYQMSRNLDDLRRRHDRAKFASTLRGRLWGVFSKIFGLYCAIRILSSVVNVVIPHALLSMTKTDKPTQSTNYPDLLTKLLGDFMSMISADVDIEHLGRIMRQISLVLVGVIIVNSLRIVLRGVTGALRVTSRNLGASLMLLILAQLMGIYLLSTVVQLRSSFPPPSAPPSPSPGEIPDLSVDADLDASSHASVNNLFSTIPEFQVFGKLFDGSFLLAAGVWAFLRWFKERVSGTGQDV